MTILVAIPFKGAPELLPRAVDSVLAQTVDDIAVLVYADGDPIPELPALGRDPRLLVHRSLVNRGPYFALQTMLLASPHAHFAPMGADDWIEPDHLERMAPMVDQVSAVITGRVWWHPSTGAMARPMDVAYEVGLFETERLRSFGGYNPAERVGQDSMLIELIRISGRHGTTMIPTYHRCQREGSLSTSPETGRRTPYRADLIARNHEILNACRIARTPAAMRDLRERRIPGDVRAALADEVDMLRFALAERVAA